MIILSHAGKQHAYNVAAAIEKAGLLKRFYTSSYVKNTFLQQWANRHKKGYLIRRFHPKIPVKKVNANWRFELKEQLILKLFGANEQMQQAVFERDGLFDSYVAKKINREDFDFFWGFQGSSLLSLKAAKNIGKRTACELSTAHVTKALEILEEEKKLQPLWADSIRYTKYPKNYQQRLEEEPHNADFVIAASDFTKLTLLEVGVEERKIIKLPLGFNADAIFFDESKVKPYKNRPLKLLYAGRITQIKGVSYLMEAIEQLNTNDVHLDIVGYIEGKGIGLKSYKGLYNHFPPVSQPVLFGLYKNYDALVIPSLFEGFGLVIIEAMAAGLPVITTRHTMGADIIEHDKNGYLVPIRNSKAITKAIEQLANKTPEQILQMKINAHKDAQRFSWANYDKNLELVLKNI